MNHVILIGRIGQQPESRQTTTGKHVATFRIAVGKDENTQWFGIVAWNKDADYVISYLGKGRLVAVEGRLQSRKYTASDGSNREVVEIVANNVQGLDRPREDARPCAGGTATPTSPSEDLGFDPFAGDD